MLGVFVAFVTNAFYVKPLIAGALPRLLLQMAPLGYWLGWRAWSKPPHAAR